MRINIVYVHINHPRLQQGRIVSWHKEGEPQPAAGEKRGAMRTTGLIDVTEEQMTDIVQGKMTIDFVTKRLKVEIDNERRRGHLDAIIKVSKTATKAEKGIAQAEFDIIKDRI